MRFVCYRLVSCTLKNKTVYTLGVFGRDKVYKMYAVSNEQALITENHGKLRPVLFHCILVKTSYFALLTHELKDFNLCF